MEIFFCDRNILGRNAKYLISYCQRVMSDAKKSEHLTHPEYTSTHVTPYTHRKCTPEPTSSFHLYPLLPSQTINRWSSPTKTIFLFTLTHLTQPEEMLIHLLSPASSKKKKNIQQTWDMHQKCQAFLII